MNKNPEHESDKPDESNREEIDSEATLDSSHTRILSDSRHSSSSNRSERGGSGATEQSSAAGAPPKAIGNYRILSKLGEGGMGVVYEAEQQNPRRIVALKVVRGGHFVDDFSIRMLQREAESLGRLKHQNIATVYESGVTSEGQHYFAMELVRGETLNKFLEKHRGKGPLTAGMIRARLSLFQRICDAVSYAHQRGVIHRDIKPTNILVQEIGPGGGDSSAIRSALPEIKILDFGLARITDAEVGGDSAVTEVGAIKGTLAYMSPEQAKGNPDGIDVRADIYSLGVLLYELLAERQPYDVRKGSVIEAVQVVCEQKPNPLETRSGANRIDPDLETITMKALEKTPDLRYQSATALSEDIERFLQSQPILARPPSTIYQIRKLVGRHKISFLSAATLVVLIVAFSIWMSVLYAQSERNLARALHAEEEAGHVSSFLVDLFRVSDPSRSRGNSITAREILDIGAEKIETELADRPDIQAAMMTTMGEVYIGLGLYDEATPLLQGAYEKRVAAGNDNDPDMAPSLQGLAILYEKQGRYNDAEPLIRRSLKLREEKLGPDHPEVAATLNDLARLCTIQGNFAEAEPLLERSIALSREQLGDDDPGLARSLHNLAKIYISQHRYEETEQLLEQSLEIQKRILGEDHPDVADGLSDLAVSYSNQGRYGEAEPLLERALAIREKILEPDHPDLAAALNSLATLYQMQMRYGKAKEFSRRALRIQESTLGVDHPEVAHNLSNLALICRLQGSFQEAETLYRHSLVVFRSAFGPDHPHIGSTLNEMGELFMEWGHGSEAESHLKQALEIRERALAPDHPDLAETLFNLGDLYRGQGRMNLAEPLYRRTLEIRRNSAGADPALLVESLDAMTALCRATGKRDEAQSYADEASAIRN